MWPLQKLWPGQTGWQICLRKRRRLHQTFLDIADVLMNWNRSDMHLPSGVVSVVCVHCSFKSGVHEWRWPTQAQMMRSDILRNIDVLGREYLGVLCRYLREEGESAFQCLGSALVRQPVLLCSVIWRFLLSATRSADKQLLLLLLLLLLLFQRAKTPLQPIH